MLHAHRIGVEPWVLSSSTVGARPAGELGLPLVVGHHLRPGSSAEVVARYREDFRPSARLDAPRVTVSVSAICADTDREADDLALPLMLISHAASTGRLVPLPTPEQARASADVGAAQRLGAHRNQLIGSPDTVRQRAAELVGATGADELMAVTLVYDVDARLHSLELLRDAVAAEPA